VKCLKHGLGRYILRPWFKITDYDDQITVPIFGAHAQKLFLVNYVSDSYTLFLTGVVQNGGVYGNFFWAGL